MKKEDLRPKTTRVEVRQEQDLKATPAVCKILKSKNFVSLCNLKVCLSPNYKCVHNGYVKAEINQVIMKHKHMVSIIGMFEAQCATRADRPVHPELLNKSPRELALQIENSSQLG